MSSDADLVFRTLVTFGPQTERALAVELGLTARRTADALAELRAGGAVLATADARTTTRIWSPRPPSAVVDRLRARRMRVVDPAAKVRSHHEVMRGLRNSGILPVAGLPGLAGEFAGGLRYLPTRGSSRHRLGELVSGEIRQIWSMTTEQMIDAESARAASPLDLLLTERGVHCRVLQPPPADGDSLDVSGHLVNGTTFKRYESADVPLKVVIIDRRAAMFPVDPANLEHGYLEANNSDVLEALIRLYDRHWDGAAAQQQRAVAPIQLSDRERSLITLLASGHTDHTAAQRLRISPRSVTGTLRSLMDRLGVDNRFQLGLALGALQVTAPPSITTNGE
ncbi:helix-turn-helix transcriptional regulator [Actinoplanes sp. N902-109]|uniref:helix-turn-helix domain-containing protein n=1 Tax=Actinoplanes sp. (strain N902-109) TaxID=649831 RepID=UPI0003293F10|nr:helix-turn-helix transcriptional regulator [Actinoplanes sp. N902-109]AGL14276.1 LuxR family transcriptional regulator [Actinoplanes sp. N902-109]